MPDPAHETARSRAHGLLILTTVLFGPAGAGVATAAEDFEELVTAHRHELTVEDGRLAGAGGAWLIAEADRAHFFMFGEQHATADIEHLASAMMRSFRPLGYQRAAVEVGPWSTPRLEALLRDGRAYEDYIAEAGRLLTFPFFFFEEVAAFGRVVIEESDLPSGALWGVDQEFIAGAGPVLDLLDGWAATDLQRDAVAEAREKAAANPMLLGAGDAADWQALVDAFADGRHPEARRLLDEVMLSRRIYAPFVGRGGSIQRANAMRERYMKTHFDRHLAMAEAQGTTPKVFLKFGANHVFDGRSPSHVLSLGNHVREIGWERDVESFNVHVDCQGGEVRDPRSGATAPCTSYLLGSDSAFAPYLWKDRMTLIDLRSIRAQPRLWKDLDERSRKLIVSFDAYVAIPDVKPATPLGAGSATAK